METEYVFLDTSEFVSASFNFNSPQLKGLKEKAENGSIRLLTTDVVYREVGNRIAKYADEAFRKVGKLVQGDDFRTLRHLLPNLTKEVAGIKFDEIKKISQEKFDSYLKEAGVTVLSTDEIRGKAILDLYFEKKPPFGEGKKKDEFPDAFTLLALQEWAAKERRKAYVISNDGDVRSFAEASPNLLLTDSSPQFLQLITEHEQNKADFDLFIELFNFNYEDDLREEVERIVSNYEVISSSFYEYVEFEKLKIEYVNLTSSFLIDVDGTEDVTVFISANVTFKATTSYRDFTNAPYDSEGGFYLDWDEKTEEIEDTIEVNGTLDYKVVKFPPEVWADIKLQDASLKPDIFDVDLEALLGHD